VCLRLPSVLATHSSIRPWTCSGCVVVISMTFHEGHRCSFMEGHTAPSRVRLPGLYGWTALPAAHGRASRMRFIGVSAARRNRLYPAASNTSLPPKGHESIDVWTGMANPGN
jgi:hypothetical protein